LGDPWLGELLKVDLLGWGANTGLKALEIGLSPIQIWISGEELGEVGSMAGKA
jgi:hypothetical protein